MAVHILWCTSRCAVAIAMAQKQQRRWARQTTCPLITLLLFIIGSKTRIIIVYLFNIHSSDFFQLAARSVDRLIDRSVVRAKNNCNICDGSLYKIITFKSTLATKLNTQTKMCITAWASITTKINEKHRNKVENLWKKKM